MTKKGVKNLSKVHLDHHADNVFDACYIDTKVLFQKFRKIRSFIESPSERTKVSEVVELVANTLTPVEMAFMLTRFEQMTPIPVFVGGDDMPDGIEVA